MILKGIRVLEWGVFHQAPLAASLLGSLGAEVIKIEEPGKGDYTRGLGARRMISGELPGGRKVYFECMNRNKKSIMINLKSDKGREIVHRLVAKSDVFLHNWRMSAAMKLGMDYETLSKHNPNLIYAVGSALGLRGPDKDRPGLDYMGQARSGIMWIAGEPGMPPLAQMGLGDEVGALVLALGVVAALLARERLGIAQQVDTSLLSALMWLQHEGLSYVLLKGVEPPREAREDAQEPLYNTYQCRDGKWIMLAQGFDPDRYWPRLCAAFGREDLAKDPRFDTMEKRNQNRKEAIRILDGVFATKTRDEWLSILEEIRGLIFEGVRSLTEVAKDPQALANEYIVDCEHPVLGKIKAWGHPITFSKTPMRVTSVAPELGEHTEEVLQNVCGYSWDEIAKLRDEGAF